MKNVDAAADLEEACELLWSAAGCSAMPARDESNAVVATVPDRKSRLNMVFSPARLDAVETGEVCPRQPLNRMAQPARSWARPIGG
jgi:hypothetical protein